MRELLEAIDRARLLRGEGDVEFLDLFDEMDHEELARLVIASSEVNALWNLVRKAVDAAWVESYHRHGSLLLDGRIHVYAKKTRTDEKCIDEQGFVSWLAQNPDQVPAVVPPNAVRKGSLPKAVRSTFFEKRDVEKPETAEVVEADVLELVEARKAASA